MGRSGSGAEFERTDLFNPNRNDVIPPNDNFSDARLPQRQCAQDRCDNRSERRLSESEQAFRDGYRQAYRDGFMDGQREQPVRVGSGRGSYCPDYDSYAISRQVNSQLEAWRDQGDDFGGRQRRPIPQCRHHHQQRYSDSGYYDDRGPSRYGDVQAVSAGQYDYYNDYQQRQQSRNPIDQFFGAIGSIARGIGDVAYEAQPILQTWAQIEMIKNGGFGGRYFGGQRYGYYDRPYNPWNSPQNRGLIAYNNNRYDNSGYYNNYNPMWMNG